MTDIDTTAAAEPSAPPAWFVADGNGSLARHLGRPLTTGELARLWACYANPETFEREVRATLERERAGREIWQRH